MIYKLSFIIYILIPFTWTDDITSDAFGAYSNKFRPAAFGDFNADKLTDMFVINKLENSSYTVSVLFSNTLPPYLRPIGPSCLFTKNVVSVVPSDFDGDGVMDVLVIVFNNKKYECYILWGQLKVFDCVKDDMDKPLISLNSQPILLDYNGDMISDIYGDDVNGTRHVWLFNEKRGSPTEVKIEDENGGTLAPLRTSGGHAFVDVNGDLSPDIIVAVDSGYEIWLSSDDFKSFTEISLPEIAGSPPSIIGQSAFADFDMDGTIEMILPLCSDTSCSQSLFYLYDFQSENLTKWTDLNVNLVDVNELTWTFPSGSQSYLYTNTINARIGDRNLDGYPDILITLFNGYTPKVVPLVNQPCTVDCQYPRTFKAEWDTFKAWPNAVMGTFYDFLEDGLLDVVLVNASTDGQQYSVWAYKDPVEYDVMFLKVLVLSGVCYHNCTQGIIPYGTNQPGPAISYVMTSASGGIQKACAGQMSQTGQYALQLPFTVFGLGRNWNFVDKLEVGISSNNFYSSYRRNTSDVSLAKNSRSATFTQIIPNSQLVVIPYPIDQSSLWITKIFITPSKALLFTAGSLIATCLFVGAIIVVLHIREKQQDKLEKRQQAQRFNFDAM